MGKPPRTKPGSPAERPASRTPREYGELLQSAGLRRTASRVAVLQFLERAKAPLSHGEVAREMAVLALDQATVFRNLNDLAEAGLISRADLGDHVWRFAMRHGGESHGAEHPHFLCTSCGDVTCLPGVTVKLVATRGAPRAIASRAIEVQVKGHCDTCGGA